MLGIGAFARAAGLSQKALRLYDGLGLLVPARVDPVSGYRYYDAGQLEQARLVAWLRRLGMPLARIREVCALDGAEAAGAVRAYWRRVEAETAARRDLAAFLVDHLSREGSVMTVNEAHKPLRIRYAALSDRGRVRASNQDTAYADARLLAVADGCGGAGAQASAAVVGALREGVDAEPAGSLLGALAEAVERARHAVDGAIRAGSGIDAGEAGEAGEAINAGDAGTTLTAMLWTGSQLALVHIGDSRAYLLRDGGLFQITHDHTLVQSLVDEGRLTPEEAASHPQRSLLVRALGGGADATPELRLQDARPGDRYLLCSDGLSAVVPTAEIRRALTQIPHPEQAVRDLVALANASGGPDNVSCVVADVVDGEEGAAVPESADG